MDIVAARTRPCEIGACCERTRPRTARRAISIAINWRSAANVTWRDAPSARDTRRDATLPSASSCLSRARERGSGEATRAEYNPVSERSTRYRRCSLFSASPASGSRRIGSAIGSGDPLRDNHDERIPGSAIYIIVASAPEAEEERRCAVVIVAR